MGGSLEKIDKEKNEDEFITFSGFAFKHKVFKDDEISISRILMTCGADTSVIGLKSDISNLSEKIEIGAWYTFIGKAKKHRYLMRHRKSIQMYLY